MAMEDDDTPELGDCEDWELGETATDLGRNSAEEIENADDDQGGDEYMVVTKILDSFLDHESKPMGAPVSGAAWHKQSGNVLSIDHLSHGKMTAPSGFKCTETVSADINCFSQGSIRSMHLHSPESEFSNSPIKHDVEQRLKMKEVLAEEEEEDEQRLESRGSIQEMVLQEMQEFVDDMKKKSKTRLKILEQNDKPSPADSEKIRKGLETIEKLDMRLQDLERSSHNTTPTSDLSHENNENQSTAATKLRDERRKRRRLLKLKRSLEKLDAINVEDQAHLFRNIVMGPNARYFTLTPEEESLVEDLLRQTDLIDDDIDSNSIISSHVSTAFDVEGEQAVRLAEIEAKLDAYTESHSYCSSSPMASASTPNSKAYQNTSLSINSRAASNSCSGTLSKHHEAVSKALENFVTTTAVEDYLVELKNRREYEAKLEEIDKKLRQLQTAEIPTTISEEQIIQLVNDSRKEQEFYGVNE